MTIEDIQKEIVDEFSLFEDWMDKYNYLIDIGKTLEGLDEKLKTRDYLIEGCQSKVWLVADLEAEHLILKADSNTDITKGLISLLIRVLSGQDLEDIIVAELYFIERIGMSKIIGSQRSNGLVAMIKQIKLYALAYKTKLQSQS